jgi:hypothetical protein
MVNEKVYIVIQSEDPCIVAVPIMVTKNKKKAEELVEQNSYENEIYEMEID